MALCLLKLTPASHLVFHSPSDVPGRVDGAADQSTLTPFYLGDMGPREAQPPRARHQALAFNFQPGFRHLPSTQAWGV